MDSTSRSRLLKSWALEEGFSAVGIARLEPVEHAQAFVEWLERGDQADMNWMERRLEVRLDPRRLIDGARSAICVALAYWPPEHRPEDELSDLWPRVARYARGEDYHRVMDRRLKRLGKRIAGQFPGANWRAWVDTGPVLERELAARAGVGAFGKNTMLLRRDLGSWFLLGELILTLELKPDEPMADLCGTCTACLEACPTEALSEPYRLDSRRCISYWTIEHRGALPEAMRSELEGWLFGCDICQEVCPWNANVPIPGDSFAEIPAIRRKLTLAELLTMSREDYVRAFRHSAMKRAKRAGLQRNAALALSDDAGVETVAALQKAQGQVEPEAARDLDWACERVRRAREVGAPEPSTADAARRHLESD